MWKNILPTAVEVSIPWSRTTRSMPRFSSSLELERASEPVELGDDQLVAGPVGRQQRLIQFGAAREPAGCFVDEDLLTAGRVERVVLGFGMLVAR
jgi:hypothetical protein